MLPWKKEDAVPSTVAGLNLDSNYDAPPPPPPVAPPPCERRGGKSLFLFLCYQTEPTALDLLAAAFDSFSFFLFFHGRLIGREPFLLPLLA